MIWRSNIYVEEHLTWLQGGDVEINLICSKVRVEEYRPCLREGCVNERNVRINSEYVEL